MIRKPLIAVVAMLLPLIAAAAPRINFVRTVPAAHDLGSGDRISILYAVGDSDKVATFLDVFTDHANRGELKVENAVEHKQHWIGAKTDEFTLRRIRRDHPADVYLGVNAFTCTLTEHSGEGSERDTTGERIKRHHVWVDALCSARVEVLDANAKKLFAFPAKGEGTSPRVPEMTDEVRGVAMEQAARYAAITAAESVSVRRVRESIELDESAPSFDEAMSMLASERLADARAIWETVLRQHHDSAALHFDLAAVCEALGDLQAARDHYREALRLSPGRQQYKSELEMFRRRNEKALPKSTAALR